MSRYFADNGRRVRWKGCYPLIYVPHCTSMVLLRQPLCYMETCSSSQPRNKMNQKGKTVLEVINSNNNFFYTSLLFYTLTDPMTQVMHTLLINSMLTTYHKSVSERSISLNKSKINLFTRSTYINVDRTLEQSIACLNTRTFLGFFGLIAAR